MTTMAATLWRKSFNNAKTVLLASAFRPLSTSSRLHKDRVFVVGVGMTKFMKVCVDTNRTQLVKCFNMSSSLGDTSKIEYAKH